MNTESPFLSVILVTPDRYETIRKVVGHLRAQSARDRMELIIMAPSESRLEPDRNALEDFFAWRVVEVGEINSLGPVEAEGFREAHGVAVVYVEEHSFPEPGWAEALIEAHAGPWAAVGPAMTNANPRTMVSWSCFLLDFGQWVVPGEPGPAAMLASHQTSYKRAPLMEYGSRLGELMETEVALQADLLANGHQLYFEPAASTDHVNVSRLRDLLVVQYYSYRAFAARRAAQGAWSWGRRLAYIAGSPLIPVVRAYRVLGHIRRGGLTGRLVPRIFPSLMIALTSAAAGEVVGYAFGAGDAPTRRLSFELDRKRHTTDDDRQAVFGS